MVTVSVEAAETAQTLIREAQGKSIISLTDLFIKLFLSFGYCRKDRNEGGRQRQNSGDGNSLKIERRD